MQTLHAMHLYESTPHQPQLLSARMRHTQVQNVRPGYKWGLWGGLLNSVLEAYLYPVVLGGPPWRLAHRFPDHAATKPAAQCKRPDYEACVTASALPIASLLVDLYRVG
jgi:hypothetical protein